MKFSTVSAVLALTSAAEAAKDKRTFAVLHFNNKQLTVSRADPIVTPGKVSTHVHHVFGGSGFGLGSTGEDLMKSNCTNAKVNGDKSNYWVPSLYFKDPKTGDFESVELFYANVYYFFEPTNDDIKAFPVGLSILSGDSMRRDPPAGGSAMSNLDPSKGPVNPAKFTCPRTNFNPPSWPIKSNGLLAGMGDPNNKGEGVGFPDENCDGYASPLRADVHFPSCYNPKAGLTDYKNNMAWPTDNKGKLDCPQGYIHVPHLFYEAYWNTPKFADRWTPGQGKQPFVLSNGDATGYSSHADFMSGWDEKLLQHIIDTCDAGTQGMDKCPGLFYGVNNDNCEIQSPVDEQVSGILKKLPGNNPVFGWHYGGTGNGPQPQPSGTTEPSYDPTSAPGNGPASSKPAQSQAPAPGSSKPASQEPETEESKPTQTPAQTRSNSGAQPTSLSPAPSGGDSCGPRKTHTVFVTYTVTGDVPTSTEAASGKDINGFKYAGCFKDSEKRVLSGKIRPDVGTMTNEKCIDRCKSLGFSIAGTEYGGQCYCGNEVVGSEKLADSECNLACEGKADDKCGGGWALSVYSTSGEVSLTNTKGRRHAHDHVRRRSNGKRHH